MSNKEQKVKRRFKELTKEGSPKPNILSHCIKAFFVGGSICTVGEVIGQIFINYGIPKDEVGTYVSIIMIFIGAFLTGVGIYDKLGEFAGAGSIVPITGFANSIVSPAIEFKKEGLIFGVAAKMFSIAGPVLVYGIGSSVIVGIIYYFIG